MHRSLRDQVESKKDPKTAYEPNRPFPELLKEAEESED